MKHYLFKSIFSFSPLFLVWLSAPVQAQSLPTRISIEVVEGEGVTNSAHQRVAHDPVVKVEDDDHRPVSGAAVVFALPVSGASGEFLNGTKALSVVTDQQGLAVAHGIRTNDVAGKLQIYATASYRGLRARTLITQSIEAAPGAKTKASDLRTSKSGGTWKWVVLGMAAAGGAGAGIYYGTHSSGSAAGSPTSISAGTVVFGSPR